MQFLSRLSAAVWSAPMLALFLGTGLYLSARSGWFQLFGLPVLLRTVFPRRSAKQSGKGAQGVSSFGALTAALSACLGTGNIIGVAAALTAGGPGTVVWMLLSAVPGMMTCCCETILGQEFRIRDPDGRVRGGPVQTLVFGLGQTRPAKLYAVLLLGASFGMGNLTQSNAMAQGLEQLGVPPWITALALLPALGLILAGGLRRVIRAAELLIPALTAAFIAACLWIIFMHRAALPACLGLILREAFTRRAAHGYGIAAAMRYGVARGVFSNEAGLGSNALIHAGADCSHPAEQGMWSILEVGIDTVLMCTLTALALLTSGVWQPGTARTGAALCADAFIRTFGPAGGVFLTVSICLFALATLNAWSYYGRRGAEDLQWLCTGRITPASGRRYAPAFLAAAVLGCLVRLEPVWLLSDVFNGLMALPNLYALLRLSPRALALLRDFRGRQTCRADAAARTAR